VAVPHQTRKIRGGAFALNGNGPRFGEGDKKWLKTGGEGLTEKDYQGWEPGRCKGKRLPESHRPKL